MEKVRLVKKNNVIYLYVLLGEHLIDSYQCPITTKRLDDIPYFRERMRPKFQEYLERSFTVEVDNDKPNLRILINLLEFGKKYRSEVTKIFDGRSKLHIKVLKDGESQKPLLISDEKLIVSDLYSFISDLLNPPSV